MFLRKRSMFTGRNTDWVGLDDAAPPVDPRGVTTWRENMTAAMCAMPLPSYPFSLVSTCTM